MKITINNINIDLEAENNHPSSVTIKNEKGKITKTSKYNFTYKFKNGTTMDVKYVGTKIIPRKSAPKSIKKD